MTSLLKIKQSDAQKLALRASLLDNHTKLPKGKERVKAVIDHLGYIQIDTISVIERAHHHTLWTRCPDYKPEYLDQLLAEDRAIFEYWAHAMSILPISDYRFFISEFKRFKNPSDQWTRMRSDKVKALLPKILKRIKGEGALGSKDFENKSGKKSNGWWDWKPAKIGLELLYWQGKLMVDSRENFHRKYNLTERVLQNSVNTKLPSKTEQVEYWISRALQSYGIATLSEIKKFFHRSDKKAIENHLKNLVKDSFILEIEIENLKDKYYSTKEFFETHYPIKKISKQLHLLSPFDNAIIQRDRIEKLFDFSYTLECYLPQAKRVYGYFVLPILYGTQIIGRLDAKADRKSNTLLIHNIYLENDFKTSAQFEKMFAAKLQKFASFNNCSSIKITKTSPASLKQSLEITLV